MSLINIKEAYSSKINDVKEAVVGETRPLSSLLVALGVKNTMALPKITKVSINVGLGQNRLNKDMVEYISQSLTLIAGQKAVPTKAKKAIAGFKIRENDIVGYRVTLRSTKMNDFLSRLLNITLPRIREFKGIDPKQFDKQGNLTLGLRDQVSFGELGNDAIDKQFGMTITITIINSNAKKSLILLKMLGFPMKSE